MKGIRIIVEQNKGGAVVSVQANTGGTEVTLPVANASFKEGRTALLFTDTEMGHLVKALDLLR